MSRTHRHDPPRVIAGRGIPRTPDGGIAYPRVVWRKPRPGDVHPLRASSVRAVLKLAPIEYVYGLRRIELRARPGEVGRPFGLYKCGAKEVLLYSAPPRSWILPRVAKPYEETFQYYGAEVKRIQEYTRVSWKNPSHLFNFFVRVLLHELGHHHVYGYPHKQKKPFSDRMHEYLADRHGAKVICHIARS